MILLFIGVAVLVVVLYASGMLAPGRLGTLNGETSEPAQPTFATVPRNEVNYENIPAVNVYLVDLGDGERDESACEDQLVPVIVPIDKTDEVLKEAIQALLNKREFERYGENGLYNSLAFSDLRIEEARVADGRAVIRLAGQLRLCSECDIPRMKEQLRATALQFDTVDKVEIYLNGELIDDFLFLR